MNLGKTNLTVLNGNSFANKKKPHSVHQTSLVRKNHMGYLLKSRIPRPYPGFAKQFPGRGPGKWRI